MTPLTTEEEGSSIIGVDQDLKATAATRVSWKPARADSVLACERPKTPPSESKVLLQQLVRP